MKIARIRTIMFWFAVWWSSLVLSCALVWFAQDVYYSRVEGSFVSGLAWLWDRFIRSLYTGISTVHRLVISLTAAFVSASLWENKRVLWAMTTVAGLWIVWHCVENHTFDFSYVAWRVAEAFLAALFAWAIYHTPALLKEV